MPLHSAHASTLEVLETVSAESKVFYPALDGLRALAALMVFQVHYVGGRHVPAWLNGGWAGVDIFFVLSGFLITGILFDTREHPHRFRNFYVRRSLRVFPLYYGVFFALLITTPLFHWAWSSSCITWLLYAGNWVFFLPHAYGAGLVLPPQLLSRTFNAQLLWSHFWTLCVEEQFYLLWPFVVFFVRDRVKLRNLCFAVIAIVPCARFWAFLHLSKMGMNGTFIVYWTPFRLDALMLGAALALMLRGPEAERLLGSAQNLLFGATAFFITAWIVAVFVLHQRSSIADTAPWISTIGFSLVDLMSAGAVLLALRAGNVVHRVFSLMPLRRLGQISYGFYVFHLLPLQFLEHTSEHLIRGHVAQVALTALLGFVLTIGLAYLSFRFFESRFLRLKNRFSLQ